MAVDVLSSPGEFIVFVPRWHLLGPLRPAWATGLSKRVLVTCAWLQMQIVVTCWCHWIYSVGRLSQCRLIRLQEMPAVSAVFRVVHLHLVTSVVQLLCADSRGPALTAWQLHPHRLPRGQFFQRLSVSVVIKLLALFRSRQCPCLYFRIISRL